MEPALSVGTIGQAMATREELRSFRLPDLHIVHHGFELLLIDAGAHVNACVETIADLQLLGACYKARGKFVVHGLVHRDSAGCGTTLAGDAESAPDSAVDREVEICVFHHQDD